MFYCILIGCMPSGDSCCNFYDQGWLYSSNAAATPLFDGSPHTVLEALVKYFHWFSQHPGISKEALSSMLEMQRSFLPDDNNLPNSYEAALRAIEPYLVEPTVYDVCINDCVVFRKEYASNVECPKCGSGRYISPDSRVPVRKFTYLPLKPRLARMFGTASTAAVLQSHEEMAKFLTFSNHVHGMPPMVMVEYLVAIPGAFPWPCAQMV